MSKGAYYNEIDPYAAQWLRNLIKAGHIAPGYVDERSIVDVRPDDLREFTQCHFFAGVGVWSYALRQAGWPDDKPVWTGSCPCQPFSAAGKGDGFDDERHLWPAFFHLIQQRRPPTVFGEQVASKDGLTWLDLVQADLEGANYTPTAVDLCAAGFGAPNIRQRLFWVADTASSSDSQRHFGADVFGWSNNAKQVGVGGSISGLDNTDSGKRERQQNTTAETGRHDLERVGASCGMDDTAGDRSPIGLSEPQQWEERDTGEFNHSGSELSGLSGAFNTTSTSPVNGFWRNADWLLCRDGKWRPVEPGTFPLADGIANRVGRLRAYGNAINAEAAKAFIRAYLATPLWMGFDPCGVAK